MKESGQLGTHLIVEKEKLLVSSCGYQPPNLSIETIWMSTWVAYDPEEEFFVHAIINRRKRLDGNLEYLVEWVGEWADTWEPRDTLLQQGFHEEIALLDEWYRSEEDLIFSEFALHHRDGLNYIGASADGRCAFRAVQYACILWGNDSWYTDDLMDRFVQRRKNMGDPLPTIGISDWRILRDFIWYGNQTCTLPACPVDLKIFKKNLLNRCVRDLQVLISLVQSLPHGIYICAGYNRQHRGHAFLLLHALDGCFATDEDFCQEPLASYLAPWWFGGCFLRSFELRDF